MLQTPINFGKITGVCLILLAGTIPFGPALPSIFFALFLGAQLGLVKIRSLSLAERLLLFSVVVYLILHFVGLTYPNAETTKGMKLLSRRVSIFLIPMALITCFRPGSRNLNLSMGAFIAGTIAYGMFLNIAVLWDLRSVDPIAQSFWGYDRDDVRTLVKEMKSIQPINAIYFGLLLNLSTIMLLHLWSVMKMKWLNLVGQGYILFAIWLNAGKLSILLTLIIYLYFVFLLIAGRYRWSFKRTQLIWSGLALGVVLLFVLLRSVLIHQLDPYTDPEKRNLPANRIQEFLIRGDTMRVSNWKSSIAVIREYPITGVGTYNGVKYLQEKRNPRSWNYRIAANAHNQFFEEQLQFGLPGTLAFLGLLFPIYLTLWRLENPYVLATGATLLITMLIESILFRNIGILCFSIFGYLCIQQYRCR